MNDSLGENQVLVFHFFFINHDEGSSRRRKLSWKLSHFRRVFFFTLCGVSHFLINHG